MLACFTALLTAPRQARVMIYTDSKMTIDSFNKLSEFSQLLTRKKEKISNYALWLTIHYIIKYLDLLVILIKVKAHSNIRLNEKANAIAKAALTDSNRLVIDFTIIPTFRLIMNVDFLNIETLSQRCVKWLLNAKNLYNLLQFRYFSQILLLSKRQHIYWKATIYMLNSNSSKQDMASTSFA